MRHLYRQCDADADRWFFADEISPSSYLLGVESANSLVRGDDAGVHAHKYIKDGSGLSSEFWKGDLSLLRTNYQQWQGAGAKLSQKIGQFLRPGDKPESLTSQLKFIAAKFAFPKRTALSKSTKCWAVYVPATRTLRPTQASDASPIRDRYANDHSLPWGSVGRWNRDVYTGERLRARLTEMLLGDVGARNAVARYERWLSASFFEGKPVTLLPRHGKDTLYLRVGDTEYSVLDFGRGIQSLIVLTSAMVVYDEGPLLLLIDEPEISMHAGLQRLLVEALLDVSGLRDNPMQTVVATHSTVILDRTLQSGLLSVWHSRRLDSDGAFVPQPPKGHDESAAKADKGAGVKAGSPSFVLSERFGAGFEVVRSLGAMPSQILLANSTIWVEGPSDRLYFHRYIDLCAIHFGVTPPVLNLHYAFVSYGGANVSHLLPVQKHDLRLEHLCGPAVVVADRDDPATKQQRRADLKRHFGDAYIELTHSKEVENLLPWQSIECVVRSYEGDRIGALQSAEHTDYRDQLLGTWIDKHVFGSRPNAIRKSVRRRERTVAKRGKRGAYADSRGSIYEKVEFARRAVESMVSFEQLTEEAQELSLALLNHVRRSNGCAKDLS